MLRDFAISLWSHGALTGKPLIDPAIHLKRFRRSCIWLGQLAFAVRTCSGQGDA